jgi:hypothetical protein
LVKQQIILAGLDNRELACLEEMQVALAGELRCLAQLASEKCSGPWCDMGKQGSERVHWDDRQYYRHQS